jgi:tRNA1Val (adenine37-N6)-methyltransferase
MRHRLIRGDAAGALSGVAGTVGRVEPVVGVEREAPRTTPPDPTDDELTLDALTVDVSVFQRAKGHRFSSDDVVTAWVAMQVCPEPARVLDLGCGIGSVLLHVAWSAPRSSLVGVEVQAVSVALGRRNVDHNGLVDRVRILEGDLREPAVIAALGGPFDLITGTPPYFGVTAATAAMDTQRAYARIEHRGGIEAYTSTATQLLTPDGWFVVCGDANAADRMDRAASACGLAVCGRTVVVPRAGRPPLFSVWALRHGGAAQPLVERTLTLRDDAGARTDDARTLRAFSGFPEREAAHDPVRG